MEIAKQKDFLVKVAFATTVIGIIYVALKLLSGVLFPFAAAAVLTVLLQDFIRKWSKKLKLKKKAASVAVVILVYIFIGAFIFGCVYMLYKQLIGIVDSFPQVSNQIGNAVNVIIEKLTGFVGKINSSSSDMLVGVPKATLQTFTEKIANYLTGTATAVAKALPFFLLSTAVMIIASAYFAKDYDEISRFILKNTPKKYTKKILKFKRSALTGIANMLRGYLVIMILTFVEVMLGLTVIKVKYSVVIALITAIVDILPVLGSGTVLIPWSLFCILTGNISRAVGLIVLYLVVTVIRNVLEPKIIGKRLGVHPLIMLAAVFVGLKLFGGAGIVLVPLTVIAVKSIYETNKT